MNISKELYRRVNPQGRNKVAKEKIINVTLNKSGTSSVEEALRRLGYSVSSLAVEFPYTFPEYKALLAKIAYKHNAVSDLPWPSLYPEYFSWFPDAKMILCLRPVEDWIESCIRNHGGTESQPRELIYGPGKSDPGQNAGHWKDYYKAHTKRVFDFVEENQLQDRFLCLRLYDSGNLLKLESFLDNPKNQITRFPHTNKT